MQKNLRSFFTDAFFFSKIFFLSRFSLQSDDPSGSLKMNQNNEFSNQFSSTFNQLSNRKSSEMTVNDALFSLETNQDQRPMTSGPLSRQTNEEQLANDFTNEELMRFLP